MARVRESGAEGVVTIDGSTIAFPTQLECRPTSAQAVSDSMAGRRTVDLPWAGEGLPLQADAWEFALEWGLVDDDGTSSDGDVLELVERLRVHGAPVMFTDWKARYCRFLLQPGQTGIYLPRPDAFGPAYAGFVDAAKYGAAAKLAGVTVPVEYQAEVTAATVVTAGELWLSRTQVVHPYRGGLATFGKLGTAPTAVTELRVEYVPLWRVMATGAPTRPVAGFIGLEGRSLFLVEVG
ncbi:MAG: hypothetical protein WA208_21200 [Thermoanaerobaculia bacterium]